ncbi:MAG: glutamate-1-semialdehyde 2,1-aminomutase [Clostridiales bacterium]|uniref:glutamate-1-semialdehyde 2,1-aminomutase n=1 Tax=Clostridium sp. N3C TaxID=1776758 RepID=UPI00092DFB2B|nr:glutamate-1-semialdehyde 2,1-aminomutase [Clostridium sp. N3C]NLZ49900.1 glutamate-1-semialdehyde 2,1-aminomutase [Clostridiales bacterium]SCN26137.1 Glutamate-1-semialdehyde 2,1-aminomutase [Clostridium sp. N3C]
MGNQSIFEESKKYMPGGVNSPVRAFKDLPINPPVIKRGKGTYIYDEDGKEYIDFVGAWGPMILGHCDNDVVKAIKERAEEAIAFGAPTELELELAKHVTTTVDNVEMIRMVNSGTEATMSAVKLARGFTGRDKIVKFSGCYHGHFDGFLVSAGSGVMTEGIPGSAGVPVESIRNTIVANYNDIDSIRKVFSIHGKDIAAVIVEPVAGNMGVIPADKEFLLEIRSLCDEYNSILIFDEVMTGFRVAYKGAASIYNIKPDLVTYAKILGGGLPSGAYGGKRDIMSFLSPVGPVYQAGTMSGNPIVMASGLATLRKLYKNPGYYVKLEVLGRKLEKDIIEIAREKGISVVVNRCGAMLTIFFTELDRVNNYQDAKSCDTKIYGKFFEHMLEHGIYLPPSQFEAMFLNVKMGEEEIDKFLNVFRQFNI